jgi:hypothetical protein
MDKQILVELVRGNPAYQQAITQMEQKFADQPISSGDIDSLIKFLEAAVDHPEHYDKLRAAAIMDGKLDQDTLPPEFNAQVIISLLIALYGLRDRIEGKEQQPNQGMMPQPQQRPMMPPAQSPQGMMPAQTMAQGGLASAAQHIQAAGRGGDTMLAHINPREAAMLKNMGASGSINPRTGLREFGWNWKNVIKTILPAAIGVFAPAVGNYLGSAAGFGLGKAGQIAGTALAAGAVGAGAAALTGDNILKGGLQSGVLGGLNAGLGSEIGGAIGIKNPIAQSAVGGALIGGGMNALTNEDIMKGALQGGIGGALSGAGPQLANKFATGSPNLGSGINTAARVGGNMLTAGYEPGQAITSGALAGLAKGVWDKNSPADQAVQQTADENSAGYKDAMKNVGFGSNTQTPPATGSVPPAGDKSMDWGTIGLLGLGGVAAASALGGSNKIQQAVATSPKLTTEQQQYMSKPLSTWDWDKMAVDAAKEGVDVATWTALHWNDVSSGKYNVAQPAPALKAQGGLSKIAYLAQGSGSGRDDTIDARLSDGEYVIDAETVALLGDGSTKAGAARLDKMRTELRKQKGKKLAKGQFSASAKSPLDYMRGAR